MGKKPHSACLTHAAGLPPTISLEYYEDSDSFLKHFKSDAYNNALYFDQCEFSLTPSTSEIGLVADEVYIYFKRDSADAANHYVKQDCADGEFKIGQFHELSRDAYGQISGTVAPDPDLAASFDSWSDDYHSFNFLWGIPGWGRMDFDHTQLVVTHKDGSRCDIETRENLAWHDLFP